MMKRLFLLFIILLGLGYSITSYLLPGEKTFNFTSQPISVGNDTYYLYKYKSNNSPVLLIKNGELVSDPEEIRNVMTQYYVSKYMVSDEELSRIRQLLLAINESRNNGDRYPNKEEATCRRIVGERYNLPKNWRKLYHDDIYYFYSAATCSYFQGFIPCQKPGDIYDYVKDFFEASNSNDQLINESLAELDSITTTNVHEKISKIKNNLEEINSNAHTLETSIFRVPINGSSECRNCFGICPPVLYNHTAINELDALLENLEEQTAPLGELPTIVSTIIHETNRRLTYRQNLQIYNMYKEEINQTQALWNETFPLINESVSKVREENKTRLFNELLTLHNRFESQLSSFNLTNINETMANLTTLMNRLYNISAQDLKEYESIEGISHEIDAYLFLAKQAGVDLSNISSSKAELDVGFSSGVAKSALSQYREDYLNLLREAKKAYSIKPSFLSQIIRSIVKPFSKGVISLADAIPQASSLLYAHTALVASLSLAFLLFSLASFMGLALYSAKSTIFGLPIHKGTYRFIYFGVILAIALFGFFVGIAAYLPMTSGIVKPTPIELFSQLSHSPTVYLLLDKAQISNVNERLSCMEKTKRYLSSLNITVEMGNLSSTTCYINNASFNCLQGTTPAIIFKSSSENAVYGEDVPTVRIYVEGNKQFYEKCIIPGFIGLSREG